MSEVAEESERFRLNHKITETRDVITFNDLSIENRTIPTRLNVQHTKRNNVVTMDSWMLPTQGVRTMNELYVEYYTVL